MRNAFGHFVAGSIVAILIGFGLVVMATPKTSLPHGNSVVILQGESR
jgi:hypothetical protein